MHRKLTPLMIVAACAALATQTSAAVVYSDATGGNGTFSVSSTDLVDASQGGTTSFTGSLISSSPDKVIDGDVYGGGSTGSTTESLTPVSGSVLTLFLDTSSATLGYDITSIVGLTGVGSSQIGRSDHSYTIALRQVGGSFVDLITVNDTTTGFEVQGTVSDDGAALLGTGIDAIRFTFGNATSSDGSIYREFDVLGSATIIPAPAALPAGLGLLALTVLRRQCGA